MTLRAGAASAAVNARTKAREAANKAWVEALTAADNARDESRATAHKAWVEARAEADKARDEALEATNNEPGTTTEGAAHDDILADIRSHHWSVAVHNDYRLNGVASTFLLLTHPSGRWVKGDGETERAALTECQQQIVRHSLERPGRPYGVRIQEDRLSATLMLSFNTYEQAARYWEWATRLQNA